MNVIVVWEYSLKVMPFRVRSPDKMDGSFYCFELHLLHFSILPDDTVTHHANSLLETYRSDNYEV